MEDRLRELDFSLLVGKNLTQVCFGQYDVLFRFVEDVDMSIECQIEHNFNGKRPEAVRDFAAQVTTLTSLLGTNVERVVVEEGKALIIQFSNKEVLRLLVRKDGYESFQITAPGITMVV
jgi:hypothetical protein